MSEGSPIITHASRKMRSLSLNYLRDKRQLIAWVLIGLPLLIQLLVVFRLGDNMLVWDEFYYADFIQLIRHHAGWRKWLPWIWQQHNEHRILPTKIAMVPMAYLTRWNTKFEMYLSVALAALVVLGFWRAYRAANGRDALHFVPVAWFICSLAQFQNMLYGIQTNAYFTTGGVIWAMYALAVGSWMALSGAIACAFMASYSTMNGFAVWPAGLVLLLLSGNERKWRLIGAWLVAALVCAFIYFSTYQSPGNSRLPVISAGAAYRVVSFSLTLLGGSLGAGSESFSRAFGLATVAGVVFYAIRFSGRRSEWSDTFSLMAGILTFGALSCFMISAGRSAMRPVMESRYIAYSEFAVIATYLLAVIVRQRVVSGSSPTDPVEARRVEYGFVSSIALVLLGLTAANRFGFYEATEWHHMIFRNKVLIQNFETAPVEALRGIYFTDELHRILPMMREERLGPFEDAPAVLLPVAGATPSPIRELTAGETVEQVFVSPVDSIDDIGLFFATWGDRKNTCELQLTVSVEGSRAERQVLACPGLSDKRWTNVTLQRPIRNARGRRITLLIEATRATPGESVTVWTYPAYYGGLLKQGGQVLPDRNLALSLNGFQYGLFGS